MVATRPMTIEEFEAEAHERSWELIDGEAIAVTPSANRSVWIAGEIFARLRDYVRANDCGWAFTDGAGFVLFEERATVRSPDAAFVRRERLPELTDHFVPMAPDLAVEVLSPSDRIPDALSKVAMYLQAGVQLVWLVDPLERSVTVFRPDASPKTLGEVDVLDGSSVLPGFTLPLAEIFI